MRKMTIKLTLNTSSESGLVRKQAFNPVTGEAEAEELLLIFLSIPCCSSKV